MTDHDLDIFARTLFGEARGEYAQSGLAAFIAVGNVIINRQKRGGKYGGTLSEVCLKPRQFSCWNSHDLNRVLIQEERLDQDPLFRCCQKVAQQLTEGTWPDLTKNSDHYHATSCTPFWSRKEKVRLRLGNHIFYKLDK